MTGGDDDRGVPRIEIEVLQPPDLAAIAFAVTPPEYSGLEPSSEIDVTSVRVLAGSRVEVHVAPDPPEARGSARTFPNDGVIELSSAVFPGGAVSAGRENDEDAQPADDGDVDRSTRTESSPVPSLSFAQTVNESLRFRVELIDKGGLNNPDPALFGIEVFEDTAPQALLVSPARTDRALVLGSAVPLRALVRDDLGIGKVELEIYDGITDDLTGTRALPLDLSLIHI